MKNKSRFESKPLGVLVETQILPYLSPKISLHFSWTNEEGTHLYVYVSHTQEIVPGSVTNCCVAMVFSSII